MWPTVETIERCSDAENLGARLLRLTCAGECMEAVSSELSFFTLPNCFELFGFDLLADEDWRLWLLEVELSLQCCACMPHDNPCVPTASPAAVCGSCSMLQPWGQCRLSMAARSSLSHLTETVW